MTLHPRTIFAAHLASLRAAIWAQLEAVTAHVQATGALSDSQDSALAYELAALLVKLDAFLLLLEVRRER